MRFLLARTDPVQQIAAHPATLAQLTDELRKYAAEPDLVHGLGRIGGIGLGLPLIPDDNIAEGAVHLRPTPPRWDFKLHLPHQVFYGWQEYDGRAVAVESTDPWITTRAPTTADLIRGYGGPRIEWLNEEPPPAQHDQ